MPNGAPLAYCTPAGVPGACNPARETNSGLLRDPATNEIETPAEMVTRLTTILKEIVGNHRGQSVVVVSHGYVMRALLVALGFATFDELPGGAIAHTGFITLMSDGEQFTIVDMVGVHKAA